MQGKFFELHISRKNFDLSYNSREIKSLNANLLQQ